MFKTFSILAILSFLLSCSQVEKKEEIKKLNTKDSSSYNEVDMLEPDLDTLPNGKRLLNNVDSMMNLYYKEVVGSDTLKGGYILCYGIDDSTKYLYLRKANKLHLLNVTPINTSTWGLGTLNKDFGTTVMTEIDNGNGVPSSYQLFDKKSGRNLLGENISAMSYYFLKDTLFMLCDHWEVDHGANNVKLINITTQQSEEYKLPTNLPDFCDVQIESLTIKNLKLSFTAYVGEPFTKSKLYLRPKTHNSTPFKNKNATLK